jgi:L-cysteine/cystine lyase
MTPAQATHDLVQRIRSQLPAVQRVAYLNGGTLGPLPGAAIEAMAIEREYDEHTRQSIDLWDRLTHRQQQARTALGRLTGVSADHVALMHSTHEALNACLWGLDLRDGDAVVTSDEEHPGLLVPLRHVRDRLGVEVRTAAWCDDDDALVERVCELVDDRTRAVAVSHVSWVSGRAFPLRRLRESLGESVRIIVDGAQSAGVLAVDPADGWDAYTVSGQKWPCGPNGSGALALRDPTAWQPTYGAFMQVVDHVDVLGCELVGDGRRLEQSQEALAPLAGIAASIDWLLDDVGLDHAIGHARSLNARARIALAAGGIDTDRMHGRNHLLAIDVPDARAVEVSTHLLERGVLVRPLGERRIRVSFGCWNTAEEVDRCCELLREQLAGS